MENNNNGNYGSGSHGRHDKHENHSNQDENQSMSSMSSDMDEGTGSSHRQQGMGSRGNDNNDAIMSDDTTGWGNDSAKMSGSNDESWNTTGRDTYSSRQENSGSGMGDESGEDSMRMSSDNDDFNQSGFEEDNETEEKQAWRDKIRSDDSRTFNEDEPTWKEEKRMSGMDEDNEENEGGSGADYGSRNAGTANNNWDANDQMQRGNGLHNDEEDRNSAY
jgi:hypothetical protein